VVFDDLVVLDKVCERGEIIEWWCLQAEEERGQIVLGVDCMVGVDAGVVSVRRSVIWRCVSLTLFNEGHGDTDDGMSIAA
jgi:hypothetical protein